MSVQALPAVLSSPHLEGTVSAPSSPSSAAVEALLALLVSPLPPNPTPRRCRCGGLRVRSILPAGAETGRGNKRERPGPDAAGTPTKATTPSASVASNAPSTAAPRRAIFASLKGIVPSRVVHSFTSGLSARADLVLGQFFGTVRRARELSASAPAGYRTKSAKSPPVGRWSRPLGVLQQESPKSVDQSLCCRQLKI